MSETTAAEAAGGRPAAREPAVEEEWPDLDPPVYLPCEQCRAPVTMRQAQAALVLTGAALCAACLPF